MKDYGPGPCEVCGEPRHRFPKTGHHANVCPVHAWARISFALDLVCDGCGKDAVVCCTDCHQPFCEPEGCPNEEHACKAYGCDWYVNPFAMGDEDGQCGKPGRPEKFRRKSDGKIGSSLRCSEHSGWTNDQWEPYQGSR